MTIKNSTIQGMRFGVINAYVATISLSPDTQNVTVVQSLEELHERGIRVLWTVDDLTSDISMSTELES